MKVREHRGGLSGKARQAYSRHRAARLYADERIAEYLDSDSDEPRKDRYIPIRSRKEFLPSVSHTVVEKEDERTDEARQPNVQSAHKDQQYPFSQTANPMPGGSVRQVSRANRRSTFTFGGFCLGCAMGGVAAAVLLLIVQTVIR